VQQHGDLGRDRVVGVTTARIRSVWPWCRGHVTGRGELAAPGSRDRGGVSRAATPLAPASGAGDEQPEPGHVGGRRRPGQRGWLAPALSRVIDATAAATWSPEPRRA